MARRQVERCAEENRRQRHRRRQNQTTPAMTPVPSAAWPAEQVPRSGSGAPAGHLLDTCWIGRCVVSATDVDRSRPTAPMPDQRSTQPAVVAASGRTRVWTQLTLAPSSRRSTRLPHARLAGMPARMRRYIAHEPRDAAQRHQRATAWQRWQGRIRSPMRPLPRARLDLAGQRRRDDKRDHHRRRSLVHPLSVSGSRRAADAPEVPPGHRPARLTLRRPG